jgi:hypothetical protein
MWRSSWGFSKNSKGDWLPAERRAVTMIPARAYLRLCWMVGNSACAGPREQDRSDGATYPPPRTFSIRESMRGIDVWLGYASTRRQLRRHFHQIRVSCAIS